MEGTRKKGSKESQFKKGRKDKWINIERFMGGWIMAGKKEERKERLMER